MRYLVLCFSFLLLPLLIKAQDTIVKRDGEKIIAKLAEVNPNNVRYKRFDYQDGPMFTLQKEEIKFIIYANGVKDIFENYVPPPVVRENFSALDLSIQATGKYYYYKERRISEPEMLVISGKLKDPKINLIIKKVEDKKFIQNVTAIGSIPLFVSGLYIYEANRPTRSRRGRPSISNSSKVQAQKNGEYLMLAGLACDIASVSFMFDRRKHDHIVVNVYNEYIKRN